VSDKLSDLKLYQLASSAQELTESAAGQFPPFEGLALSIQLKKTAKAALAHITEAFSRHNAEDRISLLRLAEESIHKVIKGLSAAERAALFGLVECEKLSEDWASVNAEIVSYIVYLESGGQMEAPIPEA
jgi:four helix bundle protein